MLKRPQAKMAMKLVIAGVPGEVASIVGATCYDQHSLNPGYGRPVQGEQASRVTVYNWFQRVTDRDIDQVQIPKPGRIPKLPKATREQVNLLLDELFGLVRPDLFAVLRLD